MSPHVKGVPNMVIRLGTRLVSGLSSQLTTSQRISRQALPGRFQIESVGREAYWPTQSCVKALVGSLAGKPFEDLSQPKKEATQKFIDVSYSWVNGLAEKKIVTPKALQEETRRAAQKMGISPLYTLNGSEVVCQHLLETRKPIFLFIPMYRESERRYFPHMMLLTGFVNSEKRLQFLGVDASSKDTVARTYAGEDIESSTLKALSVDGFVKSPVPQRFPESLIANTEKNVARRFSFLEESERPPVGFVTNHSRGI